MRELTNKAGHGGRRLLIKTPEEKTDILNRYTNELLLYSRMILECTEYGRQNPAQFTNFKVFVPSCLYLMKRGLDMYCDKKKKNYCIIRRCAYLQACLPETNTLDYYNIPKTVFTSVKNNILQAVRESTGRLEEIALFLSDESTKLSI
jgi:hypothetical protein